MSTDEPRAPLLRVVAGGDPTPTELAALVVAITSSNATGTDDGLRSSRWNDRRALLRRPLSPGPGAWRHSLR
jgi:hypothetical protein